MSRNRVRAALLAVALMVTGLLAGLVVSAALPSGTLTQGRVDWQAELAALDERIAKLPPQQQTFVLVARRVTPAVVTISSERLVRTQDFRMRVPDEFRRFFDDDDFFGPRGEGEQRVQGLGSGVIVDPGGIILTNNHVVAQADEITVTLADNRTLNAEVVGTDPLSDLAVLRIDAAGLPSITFGNSDEIEVGEWVMAVGNPFSESLRHTVTAGIVSAKGRERVGVGTTYQEFIQTDAAINRGNSGGALVNMRGELVGINTAIASGNGIFSGVGFAIPSNLARFVMESLLKHGKVIRGWLGVEIDDLDDALAASLGLDRPTGALVSNVLEGTPAAKAGLRRYDVVLALDGKPVNSRQDLTNRIGLIAPGTEVKLKIWRDKRKTEVRVNLGERPAGESAEPGGSPTPGEAGDAVENLGLEVSPLTDQLARRLGYEGKQGIVITRVRGGSVAQRAGLRRGDLIQEVNRRRISSVSDFKEAVADLGAGDAVILYIRRGEQGGGIIALKIPD